MNTAIFVPVRLSSTRLPSKGLLNLHGKPCLQLLIERLKRAKNIDLIILCTTKEASDDNLVDFAKKNGIKWYRGKTSDIIDRYYHAAKEFNVDTIINVDGDDIFCEPSFIERTAKEMMNSDIDFIIWKDLPLGSTPLGVKVEALTKVWKLKETEDTETGWARFFTDTGLFNFKILTSENPTIQDSSIRLTLDYPEDFKLLEKIYENLEEPFSLEDIVNLLRRNPELRKINDNLHDVYMKNFKEKSAKINMKGKA